MKLATYRPRGSAECSLGASVGDGIVGLSRLAALLGESEDGLASMAQYLGGLPDTQWRAEALLERAGEADAAAIIESLAEVILLAPVPAPAALLDFGLTPRHLASAARTLIRREFGRVAAAIVGPISDRLMNAKSGGEVLPYYKGNHHAIIGTGDTLGWPSYSAYLDIEPELGMVLGATATGIAGYLIFNDASARDVQFPEMFGTGPARAKDFDRSNGLGPWLVTPDEIPDPLNLKVEVRIGADRRWEGHTSEYVRRPEEVVAFIKGVFTPVPGTVVGMGTVPDTTGLDRDEWLEPGDEVHISFEGLGTLVQRFPEAPPLLTAGRWEKRDHPAIQYKPAR